MSVFVIIRQPPHNDALWQAVEREFDGANYDLGNGIWLVASAGTAKDVSEKLGVTPDRNAGAAVIIEAASYYGRANPAIWTWMKNSWEAVPNG